MELIPTSNLEKSLTKAESSGGNMGEACVAKFLSIV